jgi:hypothetical protein
VVADVPHPIGAPAHDLPPQPAVFAPDYAFEEIVEIAQKLRKQAGLPDKPTGLVSEDSDDLVENLVEDRLLAPTGEGRSSNAGRASVPAPDAADLAVRARAVQSRYLTSESILNIGRYIEMMITPTIRPTPIIISGSMIEVSDWIEASTSSS